MADGILSANPVKVACSFDEAFDRSTTEKRKILHGDYARTRDLSLLDGLTLPGKKPMWFYIKRLKRSLILAIHTQWGGHSEQMAAQAFRMAVVKVENLPTDEGDEHASWTPRSGADGLTMEEVDLFLPAEVLEIGQVAIDIASLRRGKQLNSLLLESSVSACANAVTNSRLVDESPAPASPKPENSAATSTATTSTQS